MVRMGLVEKPVERSSVNNMVLVQLVVINLRVVTHTVVGQSVLQEIGQVIGGL